MKKYIKSIAATIFCITVLSGCGIGGNEKQTIVQDNLLTNTKGSTVYTAKEDLSYSEILSYKTDDYLTANIASFNNTILPEDGDLTELLADYANVIASITEEDKNYEFIKDFFGVSLNELYCEQTGETVSISNSARKVARPLEPLNEKEEKEFIEEPAYSFMFSAFYSLQYNILTPESLSVGERNQILKDFHLELESYVDKLSENNLMSSGIKKAVANSAETIAERLSTDKIELICTIDRIEVHNDGEDAQY